MEKAGLPKSPSKAQEGPGMEVLNELELVKEQLIESNDETACLILKFAELENIENSCKVNSRRCVWL